MYAIYVPTQYTQHTATAIVRRAEITQTASMQWSARQMGRAPTATPWRMRVGNETFCSFMVLLENLDILWWRSNSEVRTLLPRFDIRPILAEAR